MSFSPEQFLPQQGPMQLIDSIIEINEKSAICHVIITKNNIFYDSSINGLYSWIGIELMAQTIAVFATSQKEQEPQIGFLMSVRQFTCDQPYFNLGESLTIIAKKEYLDEKIGVFECAIIKNNKKIATARLNAFQPSKDQLNTMLKGE